MAKKSARRGEKRRSKRRGPAGPRSRGDDDLALAKRLDRIPGWAAVAVYAAVTLLLFREFVFADTMLYGSDTLALGYMARAFLADAIGTTGFPLWNPIILGGTPFLEALAGGDSLHPLSLGLLATMETHRALGWKLVLHVFLAGVFMHAWLRVLGTSRGAAFLGGLAFLLAPHLVTLVFPGHDGKLYVAAMTPILFWSGEWFLRRGGLLPLVALAGSVALVILSTHFQMAYFLFGAMGAYMLFRCVEIGRAGAGVEEGGSAKERGGTRTRGAAGWVPAARSFGAFLLFSILGAGTAAVQLVPAVDYVTEHSRRAATTLQAEGPDAVAYGASWSLHPEEVVGLAVPEFVGGSVATADWTTDTYWGRNAFKLNHEYIGLVALLLAALAFAGAGAGGEERAGSGGTRSGGGGTRSSAGDGRDRTGPDPQRPALRWFMAGLALVVLLFTLGAHTPVWRIFYELVPGISLFRAPSMAIFLTGFAVATLAGIGVDRAATLLDRAEGRRVVRLLGGAAAVLGVGWLLAASGALTSLWTSVVYTDLEPAKLDALANAEPFLVSGFGVAAVFAVLLTLLWWAVGRSLFPAALLVPALALLVAADEWRVDGAFIEVMDFQAFAAPDANMRFLTERLEEEDEPFRVFSMQEGGQDVRPGMYGLELAAGHHPNDLGRYRELIGMEGGGLPENLARFQPNVLQVLNVRYILWPDAQLGALQGAERVSEVRTGDGRVASSVYRIGTLPRARVVGEALVVEEDETLETVLDMERFDPARQVVLSEDPPLSPGGAGVVGQARWIEREPDRLVLEVEASDAALVAVSGNWMPGWRATVGGEETPVLRADHALRAVAVPAGTHQLEMWYDPPLVRGGLAASLACLLLLVLAAGADVLIRRRTALVRGKAGAPGKGNAGAPGKDGEG